MPMIIKTYQDIANLKNEISTCEAFMEPLIAESEKLDATRKERRLTKKELKRADELIDLIHTKNVWLVKAKKLICDFYTPAA